MTQINHGDSALIPRSWHQSHGAQQQVKCTVTVILASRDGIAPRTRQRRIDAEIAGRNQDAEARLTAEDRHWRGVGDALDDDATQQLSEIASALRSIVTAAKPSFSGAQDSFCPRG